MGAPEGPGWWQASDGQWYPPHLHPSAQQPTMYAPAPPESPATKSSFVHGLASGAGCLAVAGIAFVLLIGGCGVMMAIGASQAERSDRGGYGVDRGIGSADASEDFVSITNTPADALGFIYVTVTVKNTSEKRSDYFVEVSIESPDGSSKYDDTIVMIRNVAPGQTASDKSLPVNADRIPGQFKMQVTKFQRTAS